MPSYDIYFINAFVSTAPFSGNPAAVLPLKRWLKQSLMQDIAQQNNLSETAFLVPRQPNNSAEFDIRWFSPNTEIDLCGHATLASAHVIFDILQQRLPQITFYSRSETLSVQRQQSRLCLNFPSEAAIACEPPQALIQAMGIEPITCLKNKDYLLIYQDEAQLRAITPSFELLKTIDLRGVCISAANTDSNLDYDFVSRFFAPKCAIDEDPVTGSSFTMLAPYWSKALAKNQLRAKQLSSRGGDITTKLVGDRVLISGTTQLYLSGKIFI